MLFVLAFLRQRHSLHDFADRPLASASASPQAIKTVGQTGPGKRIFGRPFVTAGWMMWRQRYQNESDACPACASPAERPQQDIGV